MLHIEGLVQNYCNFLILYKNLAWCNKVWHFVQKKKVHKINFLMAVFGTVNSTRIPHFTQNSEENVPRQEFTSISKSIYLGVFSIFPLRTFYRPSEDKLRGLRRFSFAELGGNKMTAIDDFSIKLHLAWQFSCSSAKKQGNRYTHLHVYMYKCSCHFLSLSLRFT